MQSRQGVQLAGAGRRAPDVNTAHGAGGTQDDGTTGEVDKVAGVADSKARNAGDHGCTVAGRVDHLHLAVINREDVHGQLGLTVGSKALEPGCIGNVPEGLELLGQLAPGRRRLTGQDPGHKADHHEALGGEVTGLAMVALTVGGDKALDGGVGIPLEKGVRENKAI